MTDLVKRLDYIRDTWRSELSPSAWKTVGEAAKHIRELEERLKAKCDHGDMLNEIKEQDAFIKQQNRQIKHREKIWKRRVSEHQELNDRRLIDVRLRDKCISELEAKLDRVRELPARGTQSVIMIGGYWINRADLMEALADD